MISSLQLMWEQGWNWPLGDVGDWWCHRVSKTLGAHILSQEINTANIGCN